LGGRCGYKSKRGALLKSQQGRGLEGEKIFLALLPEVGSGSACNNRTQGGACKKENQTSLGTYERVGKPLCASVVFDILESRGRSTNRKKEKTPDEVRGDFGQRKRKENLL